MFTPVSGTYPVRSDWTHQTGLLPRWGRAPSSRQARSIHRWFHARQAPVLQGAMPQSVLSRAIPSTPRVSREPPECEPGSPLFLAPSLIRKFWGVSLDLTALPYNPFTFFYIPMRCPTTSCHASLRHFHNTSNPRLEFILLPIDGWRQLRRLLSIDLGSTSASIDLEHTNSTFDSDFADHTRTHRHAHIDTHT